MLVGILLWGATLGHPFQDPAKGLSLEAGREKSAAPTAVSRKPKATRAFQTIRRPYHTVVKSGRARTPYVAQTGRDGEETWLAVALADKKGRVARIPLLRTQAAPSRSMVIVKPAHLASRHAIVRPGLTTKAKVHTMTATAYPRHGAGMKPTTWLGMRTGKGVAAVDPRVIPLGTRLFVEGYGEAIAADTGGSIKGMRIDLGFETRAECIKFGRRKVKVTVLATH